MAENVDDTPQSLPGPLSNSQLQNSAHTPVSQFTHVGHSSGAIGMNSRSVQRELQNNRLNSTFEFTPTSGNTEFPGNSHCRTVLSRDGGRRAIAQHCGPDANKRIIEFDPEMKRLKTEKLQAFA